MFRTLVSLTVLYTAGGSGDDAVLRAETPGIPKDQEAKLIAVLKSDAPRKAKADACRELARVGTREVGGPTGRPALQ